MPDSVDYEAFFELLEHPERWSDADRTIVEFSLAQQRQLLADCHPEDARCRRSLASIVSRIEAALAASAQLPVDRSGADDARHRAFVPRHTVGSFQPDSGPLNPTGARGPHRSGEVTDAAGKTTSQVAAFRDRLIAEGVVYAPRYGWVEFAIPHFDQYVQRTMRA